MQDTLSDLQARLQRHARCLLRLLLPRGTVNAIEYRCGNWSGEPGRSLAINLQNGRAADFSREVTNKALARTSHGFVDVIRLARTLQNITNNQRPRPRVGPITLWRTGELAQRWLTWHERKCLGGLSAPSARTGITPGSPSKKDSQPTITPVPFVGILPGPDTFKLGYRWPTYRYSYHLDHWQILFVIARYDWTSPVTGEPNKDIRPWIFDGQEWIQKGPGSNRPLFGTPELLDHPDRDVCVVQGEKKVFSAVRLLTDIHGKGPLVTTSSSGDQSVFKTNWDLLAGRAITIWADADPSGLDAAKDVQGILQGKAKSIRILNVTNFPLKADAADVEAWKVPPSVVQEWYRDVDGGELNLTKQEGKGA